MGINSRRGNIFLSISQLRQTISSQLRERARRVALNNEIIILPSLGTDCQFLLFIEFKFLKQLNIEWISPRPCDCHISRAAKFNFGRATKSSDVIKFVLANCDKFINFLRHQFPRGFVNTEVVMLF